MDSVVSWGLLLVLSFYFAIWFCWKCKEELRAHQYENEDFFWDFERGYRK